MPTPILPKLAVDDAGSRGAVQLVKIAISQHGVAVPLDIDNTNGLPVYMTADSAIVTSSASINTETAITGTRWESNTWTGTGEQNGYQYVAVSLQTNEAGTLFYDFSVDGTNWTTFPVNGFIVTSGIHNFHAAVKAGRYFRPRFVGEGGRSYFRLYTYYSNTQLQLNAPLNQTIGMDADAVIVRSVDSTLDLALGRFSGMTEDTKFGALTGMDLADTNRHIWHYANDSLSNRSDQKTFPSVASTFYLASDSGSDTAVTVQVQYIDSNGAQQTTNVNLTGQTPVSLGASALDVNRMIVTSATAAVGNIYCATANNFSSGAPATPSQVVAFILAGYGQTEQALYTVPLGYTMQIKRAFVFCARASGAAGSATIHLRVKPFGGSWLVKREWFITTSVPVNKEEAGLIIPERSQVALLVTSVSDNDTNLTGEWQYNLVYTG